MACSDGATLVVKLTHHIREPRRPSFIEMKDKPAAGMLEGADGGDNHRGTTVLVGVPII
jgi:hypothetical protein